MFKKFKYGLFTIALSFALTCAEANVIDSLQNKLEQSEEDSDKVKIMNEICWEYIYSHSDSAIFYSQQAIDLGERINYKFGVITGLLYRSHSYKHIDKLTLALSGYFDALKVSEKCCDTSGIYTSLKGIGDVHRMQENIEKAIEYYLLALKIMEGSTDKVEMAHTYNELGVIHDKMRQYDKAEEYFFNALKLFEEAGNKSGIGITYNNLGGVFDKQNKLELSIIYYQKAYKLFEQLNDKYGIGIGLINIGIYDSKINKFDSAVSSLQKALAIFKQMNDKIGQSDAYEALSETYRKNKEFQTALDYYKLHSLMDDSILNEKTTKELAQLQTEYETEKKQEEIEKQQIVIEGRNYLIYAITGAFIMLTIIGILINIQLRSKAKRKSIELQQKLLRSQMNPHFIFNALMSIQNYMFEKNTESAAVYLSKFSALVRLILDHSIEEYVTLNKEIETLEYYLELQKLRFENKFNYSIYIDPEIDVAFTAIPPMLAQPFIENAIEHGLNEKKSGGLINVSFRKEKNNVSFEVEDNGVGIDHISQQKNKMNGNHKSRAIEITKERLFYLNKGFRMKIRFETVDLSILNSDGKTGTKVIFTIPFKNV